MPVLVRKYKTDTDKTPIPYLALLLKLMDDASLKYFVGQVISAISKPA
jgi:hypothetical protein